MSQIALLSLTASPRPLLVPILPKCFQMIYTFDATDICKNNNDEMRRAWDAVIMYPDRQYLLLIRPVTQQKILTEIWQDANQEYFPDMHNCQVWIKEGRTHVKVREVLPYQEFWFLNFIKIIILPMNTPSLVLLLRYF